MAGSKGLVERRALNGALAVVFVMLVVSSLSAWFENFVGVILIVVVGGPFLWVIGREAIGELALWMELRGADVLDEEAHRRWKIERYGHDKVLPATVPGEVVGTRPAREIEHGRGEP